MKRIISLIVILSLSIFFFNCQKENQTQAKDDRIIKAEFKDVAKTDHGKLEITGQGEDQIQVLTLWGTPYEMGKAYGTLLKKEISDHIPIIIQIMTDMHSPISPGRVLSVAFRG